MAHFNNEAQFSGVLGHEIGHITARHGQKQQTRSTIANGALILGSILSKRVASVAQPASQVIGLGLLKYGRDDEKESDAVGMDLAARAGYDPRAALTLWRKMSQAASGAGGPEWLSTHPSHETRTREIEALLPKVMPLYERARKG